VVVSKLLFAARPDRAYFGQKDAQQCAVVTRLARDLDTGTEIVVCPTVRDVDGLALSSRNAYLTAEERERALAIPAGLAAAARLFAAGERDAARLVGAVEALLETSPALRPEYVAVVDQDTFETVSDAVPGVKVLVAARIGVARLIDTLTLGVDEPPATPSHATDGSVDAASPLGTAERIRPCTVP